MLDNVLLLLGVYVACMGGLVVGGLLCLLFVDFD